MTVEEMKRQKRMLGYTYDKIAELSGVPLGTVQKIFSGVTESPRFRRWKRHLKVRKETGLKRRQRCTGQGSRGIIS